ncbi:MAG: ATP-binding protein, partial [Chloroflexota bacterium]
FTIENLARVNVIAGRNSVGKSALLEAIFLLIGLESIGLTLKISGFRGIREFLGEYQSVQELLWVPLFHNFDVNNKIIITGNLKNSRGKHQVEFWLQSPEKLQISEISKEKPTAQKRLAQKYTNPEGITSEFEMGVFDGELSIRPFPNNPPFPGFFITARGGAPNHQEEAALFGKLIKEKRSFNLVEILQNVDRRLISLTTIQSAGGSMIFGDVGLDQLLPLSLLGDGMGRLSSIVLRIANAPRGIVLIDEIENGFHYSVLKNVWKVIGEAAKAFDTQLFITSHSYEAIRAATEYFQTDKDFALHRLDRINNHTEAISYDNDELLAAIEADFEVR